MALPYNATSPQPGDLLSQSQPRLLDNFGSINTSISEDHIPFTGSVPGQHNKISLVNQAGLPVFNPLNLVGLYSATNATTTKNELYINKNNSGGVVQVPATASILGTGSPAAFGAGWTYLPSGILLKWSVATNNGGAVSMAFGSPFTTCIAVFAQNISTGGATAARVDIDSIVAASFQTTVTGGPARYAWLAIGY